MYKNIGLALTFSPTGKALLKEAERIANLFKSKLFLIHIGKKDDAIIAQLNMFISDSGFESKFEIIWADGDPAKEILKASEYHKISLLIVGALEKESFIKYYVGSVARKIMRKASCNVIVLKAPSQEPKPFKKFYVSTEFTPEGEKTIKTAYLFALMEEADEFVIIKDFYIPGFASALQELDSLNELENTRIEMQNDEEMKLKLFVNELNLKGVPIKTVSLYGKEGWESSNYARLNSADIYCITSPAGKLNLIDRIFPHEAEYTFEHLPSNLLIVR
ncbi:MAG TPA: universal stress protein [Ignavibacteriaceae bacterium]|nr:universal stress protein [Ignavibacteriaceae bacterium]